MNKLGIIVPYRNRHEHLEQFKEHITSYLDSNSYDDYVVIVVEQDDANLFNRGMLLNIGFKEAKKQQCDYVVFHDVDMLPLYVNYSYYDKPLHLATNFVLEEGEKDRTIFDEYFGGVTLFPSDVFEKIDGYSNKYWGWGYEDDDLLLRCKENFFDLNKHQIPTKTWNTAGLEFNGHDSEVKIPMKFGLDNYSMLIECEPFKIKPSENLEVDEYSILAVPGFDTGFTFNSFKRFKFETFNTKKECISLKSVIGTERRTTLMVVVDQYNKFIRLYQDGKKIDEASFTGRLLPYHKEKFFYLGRPGPNSQNGRRPFSGYINQVAIWNHSLEPGQVNAIYKNLGVGVTEGFEGYTTPHCLECAFDAKASTYHKLIDLSGKNLNGKIHHCNRISTPHTEDYQEITIPWRRTGKFNLLYHDDNGFYENKWIYTETRKNQLRFYNQVLKGKTNWRRDGIDSLKYKLMSDNKLNFGTDYGKVSVNYITAEL